MRFFLPALRPAILLFPLAGLCSAASYQASGAVRVKVNPAGSSLGAVGSAFMGRPSLLGVNPVRPVQGLGPSAFSFSGPVPSLTAPSLPGDAPRLASPFPVAAEASGVQASALVPALRAADIQEPAQTGSQRFSLEAVTARSARIFDGKAEAPAVRPDLPGGSSAGSSPAPATPLGPRVLNRPVRLIITGPPGSGKGTYAKLLSREYGIPHISVGDLLRGYAKNHPEVEALMSQGKLVSTELVLRVVQERLRQADVVERGFILDGFPRRVAEAKALKSMLGRKSVDAVLSLEVPEEELLRRILSRGRADDNPEVFKERMRIYREDTVPAAELFRKGRPVLTPEVSGPGVEANYAGLRAEFDGWARTAGLK